MPEYNVVDSACCQHYFLVAIFIDFLGLFLYSLCFEDKKRLQLLWGFFDSSEDFKHTFF